MCVIDAYCPQVQASASILKKRDRLSSCCQSTLHSPVACMRADHTRQSVCQRTSTLVHNLCRKSSLRYCIEKIISNRQDCCLSYGVGQMICCSMRQPHEAPACLQIMKRFHPDTRTADSSNCVTDRNAKTAPVTIRQDANAWHLIVQ